MNNLLASALLDTMEPREREWPSKLEDMECLQ